MRSISAHGFDRWKTAVVAFGAVTFLMPAVNMVKFVRLFLMM